MRLVIVGGVAAGTKAASRARRVDPDLEITVYQEEPEISISECGLPYLISGVVEDRDDLVARTPEEFAEKDVEVLARHRVEKLDPERKKLLVKNLETGEEFEDSYDRLIISTGAKAIIPPINGIDLEGVFVLRFLSDTDEIMGFVRKQSPKKAVVVGGGYIGLEVSENLVELGMEVTIVEARERIGGAAYGHEVADRIREHIEEKGVRVLVGEQIQTLLEDEEGRVRAVCFGEEEVEARIVIVATGATPEATLAKEAGAEIGTFGAIRVDKHLKTNLEDVWAAGDCAESTNLITDEPGWEPLGDTANQMGRVVGTNAARGEDVLEFPGILNTGIFKVFDLGVAKTGLSEEEADGVGFDVVSAAVESGSKAGYYPGGGPVFVKLMADRATGRLIGAETVGENVDKYVDICATAIWGKLSYPDLVNLDLAYAPPFGPVLSPVIAAASILANEFERKIEGVQAVE
jgi:NADPH-dependent 2,4-dienoyl-CoA reductase/sulfur reductase-like enzyme